MVGTSSLRRTVLLRALRPDLRIEPLRGNLDTRLRKLDDGQYAAIVLAPQIKPKAAHPPNLRCRNDAAGGQGRARWASDPAAGPS